MNFSTVTSHLFSTLTFSTVTCFSVMTYSLQLLPVLYYDLFSRVRDLFLLQRESERERENLNLKLFKIYFPVKECNVN